MLPTGNLGFLDPEGVARTMPANSAPETHGNAVSVRTCGISKIEGSRLTWLVLILPLNLENVKEVGRRRVHLDQVLVWLGLGI